MDGQKNGTQTKKKIKKKTITKRNMNATNSIFVQSKKKPIALRLQPNRMWCILIFPFFFGHAWFFFSLNSCVPFHFRWENKTNDQTVVEKMEQEPNTKFKWLYNVVLHSQSGVLSVALLFWSVAAAAAAWINLWCCNEWIIYCLCLF